MNLTAFGATGGVGREVVTQALDAGHNVRAYVRNPAKLDLAHPNLTVITGKLTDREAVQRAVGGADAVISALGPSLDRKATGMPLVDGTRAVVEAMQAEGVERYIGMATPSLRDPRDTRSLLGLIVPFMGRTFFRAPTASCWPCRNSSPTAASTGRSRASPAPPTAPAPAPSAPATSATTTSAPVSPVPTSRPSCSTRPPTPASTAPRPPSATERSISPRRRRRSRPASPAPSRACPSCSAPAPPAARRPPLTSEKPLTEKLPPGLVIGEQRLLQPLGTSRGPRSVPLEPQRLQPTAIAQGVQREKSRLGEHARALEQPRTRHRPQPAGGRLHLHGVARERLPVVLDGEALGRQPERRFPARQGLLSVEAPVAEARVPQRVQHPHEPRREEGARELLLAVPDARDEAQHLRRRASPVLTALVRPVGLRVVVLHEPLVGLDHPGPVLRVSEVPVGHAPLDVEVRFDVALPWPAPLDLVLGDTECPVDRLRLPRPEDAAAVGDERLRGAVALDGGVEDGEVGGEVLGTGQGAREYGPGVVVQDGDHVSPAAELVSLEVADVDGPVLVPPPGGEGHLLFLLHRPFRLLQAVELAVEGEYAPAGPGAQVYADLGQRGMDAELPEVGVPLQPPDRLHCLEGHLAHAGRPAGAPVLETLRSFFRPPFQDPVDGRLVDLQVVGDGLGAPALGVQRDHRQPALAPLRHLVVGREAAHHAQGDGLLLEDPGHGLAVGAPPEAHVASVGYLVGVEARVVGLQVHDEAPHGGREPLAPGVLGPEEGLHALLLEARQPAVERALPGASLACPLGHGTSEQRERADLLVGQLLAPQAQELELLPVVGRIDP